MSYGISQKVENKLKSFFKQYDFIDKVFIFGSRARKDYTPKSDIDLCIFSQTICKNDFLKFKIKLDELPILYHIDVVHFEGANDELKKNILKDGKCFFKNYKN